MKGEKGGGEEGGRREMRKLYMLLSSQPAAHQVKM